MHNLRRLGCGKIPAPSNQSCIIQGVASGHKERQGREDAEGDGDRSLAGGRSRTRGNESPSELESHIIR